MIDQEFRTHYKKARVYEDKYHYIVDKFSLQPRSGVLEWKFEETELFNKDDDSALELATGIAQHFTKKEF
jgi:hypothetical protein